MTLLNLTVVNIANRHKAAPTATISQFRAACARKMKNLAACYR
jgi:hypothetical protein